MEELVALVQEKVGIPEEQAEQAVTVVVNFLKEKLPPQLAGQVDNVLENEAVMGQAGDLLDKGARGLGNLLKRG